MVDITNILEALIVLIGAIVTGVVIPLIKAHTTSVQQDEIIVWVKIAVSAAEQFYNGSGLGSEKKQYVLDWLEKNGITYDESKIDAIIESAVYELKNGELVF